MARMTDTGLALALIGAGLAFRLWLAAWLPLGLDEAYTLAVAREFSIAFFDHPPIGFWLGAGLAEAVGVYHPLVYRLPYVLLGTLTALAVWVLGRRLGGARAGIWALIFYLIAPHMVVGSGVFVLPDAPLNAALMWLAVVLVLAVERPEPPRLRVWIGAGGLLALAFASKYQAGLVPLAMLMFLVATPARRGWLATPGPWVAAAIGVCGLIPTVVWNIGHDWASFAFHAGRTGRPFAPLNLLEMTAGQMVYLLPPVAVLAVLGMVRAARRGAAREGAALGARMLLWFAGVQIGVFALVYLFGTYTFPHWAMPGWLMALPLAGVWMAQAGPRAVARARGWLLGVGVPVWALALAVAVHVPTGVLTRGFAQTPAWDDTVQIFDWSGLAPALEAGGWFDGVEMLAAGDWIAAGQMATALAPRLPMRVLAGDGRAAGGGHHFDHMAAAGRKAPALFLVPDRPDRIAARLAEAREIVARQGAVVRRAGVIVLPRGGRDHAAVGVLRIDWGE